MFQLDNLCSGYVCSANIIPKQTVEQQLHNNNFNCPNHRESRVVFAFLRARKQSLYSRCRKGKRFERTKKPTRKDCPDICPKMCPEFCPRFSPPLLPAAFPSSDPEFVFDDSSKGLPQGRVYQVNVVGNQQLGHIRCVGDTESAIRAYPHCGGLFRKLSTLSEGRVNWFILFNVLERLAGLAGRAGRAGLLLAS